MAKKPRSSAGPQKSSATAKRVAKRPREDVSAPSRGVALHEPMTVYGRIGQLVGATVRSETDLVVLVREGLSPKAVGTLKQAVDLDTELVAPETTLRRRLQENRPLSVEESERMIRIARITTLAEDLFGDRALAHDWLRTPADFLPDSPAISPMALSATDSGARLIEAIILRAEHGLF